MTNRFLLKQFAELGDKGVFGSYQAGNKTVSSDPATLQSLPAWTNGWADAISDGSHLPAMEEFQAVQYLICKAVKELYSEGIPVWIAGETYYKGAICSYIDSEGNVALYKNITGNNGTTQPALDIVNWATFSAGGGGGASAGGQMFDVVQKDHSLTFDESKGYVPLGGYAYKEGVSGSRYGYPTFYETCVSEYQAGANTFAGARWKQYNLALTENGTMGGDTFACESNLTSGANYTYQMFMLTTTTGNTYTSSNNATITFYNPTPLNITKIVWETVNNNRNPIEYTVQGSNDGTTYTDIITDQTATAGADTTMDMSNNVVFYKYHKILVTSFNTSQGNVKRLIIDAKDGTVPVKKNANGHIFYDIANKSLVDTLYNETGIAWLYGIDTTSERIALPRNDYMARGEKGIIGNDVAIGLTDDTYNVGMYGYNAILQDSTGSYGLKVGSTSVQSGQTLANKIIGLTKNVEYSGIERAKDGSDKYLYMICGTADEEVAMTEVTEVTTSENDTIPLFTHKYFEFKPNHISWVPANTVQSGDVYTSAYNTLVDCLTDNPYEIKVIDEDDEQVGVDYSEYWIVNQTNETFRTPITVSEKALDGGVKGNGSVLGLKNVGVASYNVDFKLGNESFTDYRNTTTSTGSYTGTGMNAYNYGVSTEPTKSGIIAEEATSYLYFKVDNAVQNLELIDVARIEENKADINLSNITTGGVEKVFTDCSPDFANEIMVANTTGGFVYTTPSAGFLKINRNSADGGATLNIYKGLNSSGVEIKSTLTTLICGNGSQYNGGLQIMLIPVGKNEDYFIDTSNTARLTVTFVPARGV